MIKVLRLGEFAEVGAGNSAPQNEALFKGGTLPFVRTSDVGAIHIGSIESSRDLLTREGAKGLKLFPAGTILFPKSGASTFLNHRVILGSSAYVSSHLATIKGSNFLALDRFIYYFLQTIDARDLCQDQAYPSLNRDQIAGIKVPLPSLEKQREIVEKLDAAVSEIELFEGNLELREERSNELLHSLLSVAFTFSEANNESSDSAADQGRTAKDRIPMVRLGDLCNTISGLWTGKKPPFEKATVIRNTNFTKDCNLDLSNVAVLDVETKQLKSRTLLSGDLIIEKSGGGPKQAVGRVVYFNETSGTYSLSNFTSALRVKDPRKVLPLYLRHFLYFQYTSGETENMQSHSTGIRNLNMHQFLDVRVPLPSLEKQRETVEMLNRVFAEIESLKANINLEKDSNAALRQSLLSSAFFQEEVVV